MVKKKADVVKTAHIRGLDDGYVPQTDGIDKVNFTNATRTNIETLYKVLKASPETVACLNAVVEDVMADEWTYEGSETAKKETEKFEIQANLYKILTNAFFEIQATGNVYILKLGVSDEKISSLFKTLTTTMNKEMGLTFSKKEEANVMVLIQKEFKKPKDLQILKASTMKIDYDETGKVKHYIQEVRENKRVYLPKDIVHITAQNIGGQVDGFTPLEPLLSDIGTLIRAKSYVGKYFENDGIPDWLFKLPDASPDDRNYELLKKELKELRNKKNKYRSMVLTGNIEADQLKKFDKDMEFKALMMHFTQIVLTTLGVPAYRIGYTLDNKDSATAVGKVEIGYYKKIAFLQRVFENALNKYLFSLFNVKFRFKKAYKLDEMREAQIVQILTQGGLVTVEEARELMGLPAKLPKGTMPNKMGDENSIDFDRDKREERGQEEKPEDNTDNKLKNVAKGITSAVEVSFFKFKTIVENKVGQGNFDNGNVLFLESNGEYVMFFNDGQWEYKARVPINEDFRQENLTRATKIHI